MGSRDPELIRSVYAAWNEGDVDRMLEWIDPAIEWRPGTDNMFAGLHTGIEGFARYVRSWATMFDRVHIVLGEVVPVGDRWMSTMRQFSRVQDSAVDIEAVVTHVWRVRDGRIVQWFSFEDEAEATEFLSRHP